MGHVKANMGFEDDEEPGSSSDHLLRQFQSTSELSFPVHDHIVEVLKHDGRIRIKLPYLTSWRSYIP